MYAANGNQYGADTLTLYRCWVQFHALDFDAMLESCTQVLTETLAGTAVRRSTLPAEQRLAILLKGLALSWPRRHSYRARSFARRHAAHG